MTTSSMQTVILKVGLHCDGCEKRVKKALWHMKGITSVDVDSKHERVTVTGFVDPSKVLKAVKKTGKPAEIWKYQSGNNNLYGSQPIGNTPTKFSTADNRGSSTPTKFPTPDSRGTKANNNNNNNKHVQFQSNSNKYSSQDRSHHPQPDYLTDGDSDYASSPKPQRRFDNNDTPKSQFYKEHKSSNDYSGQKSSSFKDQKPSSYKDQKSRSGHSEHKSNNRSQFGSDDENDFSYGNRQSNSNLHSGYDSDKVSSAHSSFKNQKANHKSGYDSDKASSPHSSFKNQKGNHKSSPYTGYENQKTSSYSDYNEYSKSPYSASAYTTNNEHKSHSSNQKKPNKFVSFDDDVYEQKYRPQSEAKHRNQDHGSEQKFYRTYGQEQNYYPSYSYAYHEPSYRVPPANSGFTTMFSEENPNACSIM